MSEFVFSVVVPDGCFGREVRVCGSHPSLGGWRPDSSILLHFVPSTGRWEGKARISSVLFVEYKYFTAPFACRSSFLEVPTSLIWEQGKRRVLPQTPSIIRETFRSSTSEFSSMLSSSAFRDVLFSRNDPQKVIPTSVLPDSATINLAVECWQLHTNQTLMVMGSIPALGTWNPDHGIHLVQSVYPQLESTFHVPSDQDVEYKFVIKNSDGSYVWEDGGNRVLQRVPAGSTVKVDDTPEFRMPSSVGIFRSAGVIIPVFSIRSRRSMGVGDFKDLGTFIQWAAERKMNVVQVLPVNDTMMHPPELDPDLWQDSYPYSLLSAFALHPMYAPLDSIVHRVPAPSEEKLKEIIQKIDIETGMMTSEKDFLDYPLVVLKKMEILRILYDNYTEVSNLVKDSDNDVVDEFEKEMVASYNEFEKKLKQFRDKNKDWLPAYALFCVLRDRYKTSDFMEWPEDMRDPSSEFILDNTSSKCALWPNIKFWYFVQFLLFEELRRTVEYAESVGVIVKGDLPIGVAPRGVDAWQNRQLFYMDTETGAPPDDFAEMGQNWKFPTYNWDVMREYDEYAWWKRRFSVLGQCFHAIRIDHVLGFFRIWRIPSGDASMRGYMSPSIGISIDELTHMGIWDVDRLCRAEFPQSLIGTYFSDPKYEKMVESLFEPVTGEDNRFTFKSRIQRMCDYKEEIELFNFGAEDKKAVLENLELLWTSVVLVRDMDSPDSSFYPRFKCYESESFKMLPYEWGKPLKDLCLVYFYGERNLDLFATTGRHRLEMVQRASDMLICAEDLGLVPDCVHPVLKELGILSLRVQRMPANEKIKFYDPVYYPYLSVATPSTHDMETLRHWYEENLESGKTQNFYNNYLHFPGPAPAFCEPWIVQRILSQHLGSPSVFSVFLLQDWISVNLKLRVEDPTIERINDPNINPYYWKYRVHMFIDDLLTPPSEEFTKLNDMITRLIMEGNRC